MGTSLCVFFKNYLWGPWSLVSGGPGVSLCFSSPGPTGSNGPQASGFLLPCSSSSQEPLPIYVPVCAGGADTRLGKAPGWTLCPAASETAAALPSQVGDHLGLGREDKAAEDTDGGTQPYWVKFTAPVDCFLAVPCLALQSTYTSGEWFVT